MTGIIRRDGRVAGVSTADGDIEAEYVVAAAGMWGREVGALAGARLLMGIPADRLRIFFVIVLAMLAVLMFLSAFGLKVVGGAG